MRVISFEKLGSEKGIRYSRQHIYNLEKMKRFPKRIRIGPNRIGWVESEIDDWLKSKIDARDAA
jgi:prophage regulatory protein